MSEWECDITSVTDRGKEQSGTQPAPSYGPRAVSSTAAVDIADQPLAAAAAHKATSSIGGSVTPLYRAGDLVFVRPVGAVLWVAQLTEPVVELRPGVFNEDRPRCRYFVPTAELGAYGHALAWWQQRGQGLRLDDEEAASARAASSDGVHFSFEKVDSVTRSTICGRFEPSAVMEQVLCRRQLVSFALTELALAAARNEVSEAGQGGSAAAEELAAAAAAAAAEKAAALAAAQLAQRTAQQTIEESYQKLSEKRERGKQEQAAKKSTKPS